MRHRLISPGGGKYLPFAESCIVKLLKGGLPYANQSYEVDGFSIKVRVEPGHEYIRIEGGGVEMRMDSGVVGITLLTEIEPREYFDSRAEPLHETTGLQSYNAAFATRPSNGWRYNPAKGNSGQVSGNLTVSGSGIKGKVPQDGVNALSFTPKMIKDEATGKWIKDPQDESLWTKKMMTFGIPASIFTGRCRMWVQAMYGAPTRVSQTNGYGDTTSDSGPAPDIRVGSTLGTPTLFIPKYVFKGDTSTASGVTITSGTGVTLDELTGRHWLFELTSSGTGAAFPLYSDKAGESARKLLIAGADHKLTPDELEHLEAYVLSTSRPDVTKVQQLTLGLSVPGYSMGYSWHWNWAGRAADIVLNYDNRYMGFVDGHDRYGMISHHYRTVIKVSGDSDNRVWSATSSTVEGPTEWAVPRHLWSISEPNWGVKTNEKTTPRYSDFMECDAPFYVFYKRDELQVCRVRVTYEPAVPGVRTTSVDTGFAFADGAFGETVAGFTVGLRDGWMADTVKAAKYTAVFTCGTDRTIDGPATLGETSVQRLWVTAKTISTESTPVPYGTGTTQEQFDAGIDVPTGYPLNGSNGDPPKVHYSGAVGAIGTTSFETFTKFVRTDYTSSFSYLTAVVPFNDAEAIYLHGESTTTTNYSRVDVTEMQSAVVDTYFIRRPIYGMDEYGNIAIVGYAYGTEKVLSYPLTNLYGAGVLVATVIDNTPDMVEYHIEQKLFCHAGGLQATMGDLTNYHSNDDFCTPRMESRTGCRVTDAVAISENRITPQGTTHDGVHVALVGWI